MIESTRQEFTAHAAKSAVRDQIMSMLCAVKAYAYENYEEGGWDYVIETMTDSEIAKQIKHCKTADAAIKKIGELCGLWASIEADIANEVDCDPCWDDPINECNNPYHVVTVVADHEEVAYERHLDALAFSDTERDYQFGANLEDANR